MRRPLEPRDFPFFDYRRFTFSLGIETDRGIWLAGNTAVRLDSSRRGMVVTGSLTEQAEIAYEKLRLSLAATGLDLGSLVRVVEYVVPRALEDYPKLAALRAALCGGESPPATTVVVPRLLRPEALIEVEAVAVRDEASAGGGARQGAGRLADRPGRDRDTLYIPGMSAVNPSTGQVPCAGDVAGQAEAIYERVQDALGAAGLGFEQVVRTAEWLAPAALPRYGETAGVRRRRFGAPYPAAASVVVPRLVHPDALLQVECVAMAGGRREAVVPEQSTAHPQLSEAAVRAGGVVFLSGHLAVDPGTGGVVHAGDVVGQTRFIYERFAELLAAAGAGMDAIAKTTEYITPDALEGYRRTAEVRRDLFRPPYPAATGVLCDRLPRDGALIEIEAVAVTG